MVYADKFAQQTPSGYRRVIASVCALTVTVIACSNDGFSQEILYDNLFNVRSDEDWFTARGPDVRFAQQFLIGENTGIDQVTVHLQRPIRGATGSLRFELWRDNGSGQPIPIDDPMGKVADLGKIIDITQVPERRFAEYTFDNLIVGLEPNVPYWVVTDYSEVQNINGGEQSVGVSLVVVAPDSPAPPGYDALAGTGGAAYLHAYRDENPYWNNLKEFFEVAHFFHAMTVEAMPLSERATEVIYDNTETVLSSGDRIIPSPGDSFLAQPFDLGNHDSVLATHINMSRAGTVTGEVHFSIWDDNGNGVPAQEVGRLGTIDVAQLEDVGARPDVIPQVTLDNAITGLTPDQTYFLVADVRDLNVSGNAQNPNSVVFAGLRSDAGTNGADDWLAVLPNRRPPLADRDWTSFTAFGFGRRWMQMAIESTIAEMLGDLNGNSLLDTADIDILSSAIRQGLPDARYDLNQDGQVDTDDRIHWVKSPDVSNTYFGDANLDGEFSSSDLTEVFIAGEYEDNITLNSSWAEGDWDGDGDFGSGDLIVAFQDGGYERGPRAATQAVPEPSAWILSLIGLLGLTGRHRRFHFQSM